MSAFACNKRNTFNSKSPVKAESAPEPVTLVIHPVQIITADIPFSTAKAGAIRAHMHAHIKNDEQKKIFIFRSANGWTNISLDSTAAKPQLTCSPVAALHTAFEQFNACPDVSTVTMKMLDGTVIEKKDIDGIQWGDMPIEADGDEAGTSSSGQTDGDLILTELRALAAAFKTFTEEQVANGAKKAKK